MIEDVAAGRPADPPAARWRWLSLLLCLLIFALGVGFRYAYVFILHPPNKYVYSDMSGYVGTARAWFQPGYVFKPVDTVMPPGYHWLLGFLLHLDPTTNLAVIVQFLMSIAVPVMLALMAYQMYGRAVAQVTLALSSVYFPIIDYAGYYLTEGPFLFAMVLSMLLLVSAIRARRGGLSQTWALLSGVTLGASVLLKPAVLLVAVLVFLWLSGAAWTHRWSRLGLVLLTSLAGLALLILPMSLRTTRINHGSFVLVSTGGPINFLQGHGGENVGGVRFVDPQTGGTWGWGSPATAQKAYAYRAAMKKANLDFDPQRYNVILNFDFPPWDQKRLNEAAWKRIREAPLECFEQSCGNVVETFFTTLPWPTSSLEGTPWFHFCVWSQRFYVWLILVPATLHLAFHWRAMRAGQGPGLADGLMALPVIGVAIVAFLIIPEARYRVPYDVFALVLAARLYTGGVARPDGLVPPAAQVVTGEAGR